MRSKLLAVALALSPALAGAQSFTITAEARKNGTLLYTERHNIQAEGKTLSSAHTDYLGADNKLRATLSTTFRGDLAAPAYTFSDERDGSSHGVERPGEGFLVWKKEKNQKREEKLFRHDAFDSEDLVVAGQGLFFYLRDRLANFPREKTVPVKLLIPGKLDYFTFGLSVEEETEKTVTFKMKVKSIFLRLFAPSLHFTFSKTTGQILNYEGPSNIADQSGSLENVKITYSEAVPAKGEL